MSQLLEVNGGNFIHENPGCPLYPRALLSCFLNSKPLFEKGLLDPKTLNNLHKKPGENLEHNQVIMPGQRGHRLLCSF